jgi:hypothetical protein
LPNPDNTIRIWLEGIYGPGENIQADAEKSRDLAAVLRCYGKRFGLDEKVCIVRAPGRINLMGRHVHHRGYSGSVRLSHWPFSKEILSIVVYGECFRRRLGEHRFRQ